MIANIHASGVNPVDETMAVFRAAGRKVKRNKGGWLVSCPGPSHEHGDRNPSLSVDVGKGGQVVLYCHAGCSIDDVLAAVGLTFGDLFPDDSGSLRSSGSSRSGRLVAVSDAGQVVEDSSRGVVGGGILARIVGDHSAIPEPLDPRVQECTLPSCVQLRRSSRLDCTAVYHYRDESGEARGSVHRMVHAVGPEAGVKEGFRPHTPDGLGGFTSGGSISALYRLPELFAKSRKATPWVPLLVVVCEGERDADAVNRCRVPGMIGVTNSNGAGSWKEHHSLTVGEAVADARVEGEHCYKGGGQTSAHVVVVGDVDAAGQARVRDVVESLRGVGINAGVAYPRFGKDLTDHFAHGGTLRDLREMTGADLVAPPAEHVAPVVDPERFIDKHDGLLVRALALDITNGAPIMRDLSDAFWTYRGGAPGNKDGATS